MSKTIGESAKEYEKQRTGNIADLERVSVSLELKEKTGEYEGKEFTYSYVEVEGKDYRVPKTVLEDLKKFLSVKPDLKEFKVLKKGSGLNTEYEVIPL